MKKEFENENLVEEVKDAMEEQVEVKADDKNKSKVKVKMKHIVSGIVVLIILVGGSVIGFEMYENKKEDRIRTQQSKILMETAKSEDIKLIEEDEVKKIVAEKIGISQNDINFEHIYLRTDRAIGDRKGMKPGGKMPKGEMGQRPEPNQNEQTMQEPKTKNQTDDTSNPTTSNNKVAKYRYEVKAKADGVEYEILIDAESGKILKIKLDN